MSFHSSRSLPRFLTRFAAVAVVAIAAAAPLRAETLTDALISAYKNSNLLEQNRALLRAADEDVATAVASLRPVLSYAASANRSYGSQSSSFSATLTLSADIMLFNFGRSQMAVDLARESVLATREALVSVEQNVLYSAVDAYMSVISAAEFVALRESNVRLITQELRAAQDRFELGEVTRTDVSLAEARLALARANLAAAQGDYNAARERYKAAIGHYPGQLSPPPAAPRTAKTVEAARSIAMRMHPSILQAQREVTINELSIEIAKAAMKPALTAGASTSLIDGGTTSSSLNLTLSGPIYQGGKLSAAYRKAIAQRDAARSGLLQQSVLVEQNVGIAWSQVAVAAAQLEASDRQIRASTVAYRGVREEATLGARTTLDVLNAEQELLDAKASRISAYSTYYTATYALLREMGLLTVDHLKLGIVTYDPEGYYNAVKTAPVRKVSPQGQKLDRVLKSIGKN
ncbi:TolC family outer membrane protein [Frigidibacter sp. ROC022]|uniref:TolC family outer membrane protein n=1 Tax=Frigidibacter sp. ROC022 TaxID=2971796 RepID=UPI00215ADDA2|nr:TolC family outer membrane protein [Frigidibacter sp. ROC022]MCR8726662.1 TolC family outer membrane protein [Frigidibacter sp. ROC022]